MVDNSSGFTLGRAPAGRDGARFGSFLILPDGDAFTVIAWGDIFPGRTGQRGTLRLTDGDIIGHVSTLRDTWQETVIDCQTGSRKDGTSQFPFRDPLQYTRTGDTSLLDGVARRLARQGAILFNLIFGGDDTGMRAVGHALQEAARGAPCVLSFISDTVFIPWWMLYVPPDPETDVEAKSFDWSWEGFLGYRHWIEHDFSQVRLEPRIEINRKLRVGLNVDTTIDVSQSRDEGTAAAQLIAHFTERTDLTVREARSDLSRALRSPHFDDQLMCFWCHGVVSGTGASPTSHEASLRLTDQDAIRTGDLTSWLSQRDEALPNPIVLMDACQGGQMRSVFYRSFAVKLLEHGANCLLGPQIDLPIHFAYEYTTGFLVRLLAPRTRVGDITRDLTRFFIDEAHNPLGLAFSLYHGLDTYLAAPSDT